VARACSPSAGIISFDMITTEMDLQEVVRLYKLIVLELKREMRSRTQQYENAKDRVQVLGHRESLIQALLSAREEMDRATGRAQHLEWYSRALEWTITSNVDPLLEDEDLSLFFTEDGPVRLLSDDEDIYKEEQESFMLYRDLNR